MHYPSYQPAAYYGYGQHPELCYPPYSQSYYPSMPYRRYVKTTAGEMYETMGQPPSSTDASMQPQPPQMPAPGSQLVSAAPPSSQQHLMDPYYYASYASGTGPCYTRSIATPFIGKQMYEFALIPFDWSSSSSSCPSIPACLSCSVSLPFDPHPAANRFSLSPCRSSAIPARPVSVPNAADSKKRPYWASYW